MECLIPLGNELLPDVPSEWTNIGSKFGDLLNTAAVLAGAGDGSGHLTLCAAVIEWLEKWYVVRSESRLLWYLAVSSPQSLVSSFLS